MKNREAWKATKFEWKRGRWRGSRDRRELGIGSRLMSDLVAAQYQAWLEGHARGRLLDLGCGKAPLFGAYSGYVTEVTCVDWADGDYIDQTCDLTLPLPFRDASFETIILSDVLEHIPNPGQLWKEMKRVLVPGGHLIMNVPFYYSIHAHPHDYFRYTNFALERFVQLNGMELRCLVPLGGLLEVMADLFGKAWSKVPLIGSPLAMLTQWVVGVYGRTGAGSRTALVSSRHFPLGYFLIAQRPE